MKGLPNEERQRLGALLEEASQAEVMGKIPQFSQAEVHNLAPLPARAPEALGMLVFNMERGVCLEELGDFLETCPAVRPFDVILANELDDGCVRSGGKDTTLELAKRLGMNAAFGLEFIELVNGEDSKGFHGNAIFSRWPIKRAKAVRLPEQYNWYFDRQRRIGGRLAVLAELDVAGTPVGVGAIHLENRTHGPGRRAQLSAVLAEAEAMFPGSSAGVWRMWRTGRNASRRRRKRATAACRTGSRPPGASPSPAGGIWICGWTGCWSGAWKRGRAAPSPPGRRTAASPCPAALWRRSPGRSFPTTTRSGPPAP